MTEKTKDALKRGTIELVADQIYDRLTIYFNNDRKRFGIKKGEPIIDPTREHLNFELSDDYTSHFFVLYILEEPNASIT